MGVVTQEYVQSLQPVYRDILAAFPALEPGRHAGFGLAYPTLYEALQDKYPMGEIVEACQNMAKGGAVEIRDNFFVYPTSLGEEIIAEITGRKATERRVPPFAPPR
jgi:hypothetical protein